jgi:NOL1/NOP2/fmu family ribosome biogenesis protein
VGGEVVYSTCTLLPEEDEGVVDTVLRRFRGAVEVKQVHLPIDTDLTGITHIGEQEYLTEVAGSLRLWPHRLGTAGFFACLLQKTAPLDLPVSAAPSRPLEKIGFRVSDDDQKLIDFFSTTYGFDLRGTLDEYDLLIMQRYERFIAFPRRLYERFADLPLESAGMTIGEETADGLVPSHDWVSRFGDRFSHGKIKLDEGTFTGWLRGEDSFDIELGNNGEVVVVCSPDGIVTGRGKYLKDRLKNLLPRRLI